MRIENVKIVNYNKTILNANIELENGKIKKIEEIDGEGTRILIPGFIDTHTHGFAGNDFMDGKEATEKIVVEMAKQGTTSVFPTIMTRELDVMDESLKAISEANDSNGANILGIHTEGPFISLEKKGAHNPNLIIKGDPAILQRQFNASNGMLKKVSYAPEEAKDGFIEKMLELGIMPTVGHTNATFTETIEAIEKGSLHCTHLWNAMSGVQNRNPGAAEAIIFDDRIYAELIADGIHVDKDTIMFTLKTKGIEKVIMVTDSIRPAGLLDGESESGGIKIIKTGSKIVLKGTDTIAGSGASMHDCFKNLVSMGISINDVVRMSSYNSVISLNLKEKGYIQEGMDADIVMLNQDMSIDKVFVGGKVM